MDFNKDERRLDKVVHLEIKVEIGFEKVDNVLIVKGYTC